MPTPTEFAALVAEFQALINRRDNSDDLWFDWQTGVVGGGPGGDGRYPLVNRAGVEMLFLCPAAMAAQFLGISYQGQIGFDDPIGSSLKFSPLLAPAALRFPANFGGSVTHLHGDGPGVAMVISLRHFLANGTGGTVRGTITINADRTRTLATTGGTSFDMAAGDLLVPQGPVTALPASHFYAVLKGEYL